MSPVLGGAGLGSWFGHSLGGWVPDGARIYLMILAWGLLLGMFILDEEPRWNFALLIAFAFTGGILLSMMAVTSQRAKVWSTLSVGLVLALVWGVLAGAKIRKAGAYLFPATILYLLGWVLFAMYNLPAGITAAWAGMGLILFVFIGTSVISRAKIEEGTSHVSLASDLFVVLFNLYWLAEVFWWDVG